MKKLNMFLLVLLAFAFSLTMTACNKTDSPEDGPKDDPNGELPNEDDPNGETPDDPGANDPEPTDPYAEIKTTYGEFSITTELTDAYTFDAENKVYTISQSGEYTIQGFLEGSIVFDSTLATKCTLNLNGVYIVSTDTECVNWKSESKKVELVAKEGTTNYLVSKKSENGTEYSAVSSENNVDVLGEGTLNIESDSKHAIKGSDIEISGNVTLNLKASSDGVHSKSLVIKGGTITIEASDDAIQVDVNSSGKKGTVSISNASVTFKGSKNAIKAEVSISITTSNITFTEVENNYSAPEGKVTVSEDCVIK